MFDYLLKLSALSLFTIFAAFSLNAQGGSNYSIIGIGDITDANGAFYDGVAGAATAMPSAEHINLSNPAMWTYNKSTRLQFGYRFNQQMVETGSPTPGGNSSVYQNNGMVDNISALFAIDTSTGISASLGLSRVSDINYFIANGFGISQDGLSASGKSFYRGEGGINNAHLGAAFKLFDMVSVGGFVGYYFGDVTQSVQTIFNEAGGTPTDYIRDIRISGLNYRLGLDVNVTDNLNIGLSYAADAGVDIENRLVRFTNFTSRGSLDTLETLESGGNLPTRLGIGASYHIDRLRFVADYQMTMVDGFEFRSPDNGTLENGFAIAIGAERTPSRFAGARFGEKISYRLGLGYEDLYYQLQGQDISEYFISAGITLPMPGTALLDVGMSVGQRGTLEQGLVQESFLRLNFALSIGDTWFIPFKREYD